MKTTIEITGQVGGNFTLLGALKNYESKRKGMFNGFILEYGTEQQAEKDLQQAFEKLCADEPDMIDEAGGISFYDNTLFYDASKAKLYNY